VALAKKGEARCDHDDGFSPVSRRRRERCLDVLELAYFDRLQPNPEARSGHLRVLEVRIGVIGIPHHRDSREARHHFAQEFEPLAGQLGKKKSEPGQVAARMREAGYDPGADRIQAHDSHDGNGLGGVLSEGDDIAAYCVDEVRPNLNQILGERLKALALAVGIPKLKDEVAAFHVACCGQRLSQDFDTGIRGRRAEQENAHAVRAPLGWDIRRPSWQEKRH
jgi:hypothetical protein